MYMSVEKNHSKQSTRFEQKGVCVCVCVCVCVQCRNPCLR